MLSLSLSLSPTSAGNQPAVLHAVLPHTRQRSSPSLPRSGTDLHSSVQPSLEHLAGLSDFFRRKVEAEVGDDKERSWWPSGRGMGRAPWRRVRLESEIGMLSEVHHPIGLFLFF